MYIAVRALAELYFHTDTEKCGMTARALYRKSGLRVQKTFCGFSYHIKLLRPFSTSLALGTGINFLPKDVKDFYLFVRAIFVWVLKLSLLLHMGK